MAKSLDEIDVPNPPTGLHVDGDSLSVSLVGRRMRLPITYLSEPRLAHIKSMRVSTGPRVVVASHLSAAQRAAVEARGWGWLEAGGNAHIEGRGVLVHVDRGDTKSPRRRGELSIPPQGERIVRHLLDHYPTAHRFTEIAHATKLDKGYTSRILRRLHDAELVRYERNMPVEVISPSELFELWQTMSTRTIESPWFVPRAGPLSRLAARVADVAGQGQYAFTGVFGANLVAPHVEPERIDCYLSDLRSARRLGADLGAEQVTRGVNLVLLVHRDPGVLTIGSRTVRGLTVVSPSQLYRDALLRGRGREREAADVLRRQILKW